MSIKLKKCFVRYEPDFEKGTMFLYNKEDGKMIEGNLFTYIVVKSLIKGISLEDLSKKLINDYPESSAMIKKNIDHVVLKLQEEGFVVEDGME